MSSNNTNLRMPQLNAPGSNTYPYVEFSAFRDGSWDRRIVYPGKEAYSHGHMLGSFHEVDATGAHKEHSISDRWEYTKQGKTVTAEGNHDSKIGGSDVKYISQDVYHEHGSDHMKAIGGSSIHVSAGTHFQMGVKGNQVASTGDHVTDHNDGSSHINVEGDHIHFIGNNKYESIGGENGVYVPKGNMDVNVNKKLNLQASMELTLSSNVSVTIKVGTSIITVNSGSINIVTAPTANVYLGPNTASYFPVAIVGGGGIAPHVLASNAS